MNNNRKKTTKIGIAIMGLIGFGLLIAAVILTLNSLNTKNKVNTVGTVVFAMSSDDYNSTGYGIYEEYKADRTYIEYTVKHDDGNEETIVSYIEGYFSTLYRGKTINMYYIKDDIYTIGCFESDYMLPIIFFVLGLIFIIPLFFVNKALEGKTITIGGNKIEKMKENSKCYLCKIVDIKQDQFINIGGIYPYVLYVRDENAINPVTYKSQKLFFDPSIILKTKGIDTLKVYVHRDKPDKYMVDVEPIVNAMQEITEQDIQNENRRRAGISVEE